MSERLPTTERPMAGSGYSRRRIDPFERRIHLFAGLGRRPLRRVYSMAEDTTFLPREDLLTLEKPGRLASAFIACGVRKLRLTGGKPLVRRKIWAKDSTSSIVRRRQTGRLNQRQVWAEPR
jgi:cyclic pyranopterin phosphate synthase